MDAAPKTHRDPLRLRQTLQDLTTHLESATAAGSLDAQIRTLDLVFNTLLVLGLDGDQAHYPLLNLALSAQRLCMRQFTLIDRQNASTKNRNPN